jgi:hypothetical protein
MRTSMTRIRVAVCLTVCVPLFADVSSRSFADDTPPVRLQFDINDERGRPLPCRIHVYDADGKPQRAPDQPSWNDHFVCAGRAALPLPPGEYRYEIERGPEHERLSGRIELRAERDDTVAASLRRIADLRRDGWYPGELHVHRPVEDVPLLMQAEDLDVAPVITWWNKRNLWSEAPPPETVLQQFDGRRLYHVMAGEDEREGGALLYFGLERPIDITQASREHPSPFTFAAAAREADPDVWIDIEKPFWWDVPVWLASGQTNSIGIANNHMCRSRMYENEAWGRPRDETRLPPPLGNGYWTQEIYYHALNCGLRLPPSAGSASGVLPNPVGYNRAYVHVAGELTWDKWWEGLRAGRSFVTNGPLLVCRANGELPGHVFRAQGAAPVEVRIDAALTSLDRVLRVEVVRNGEVAVTLDAADALQQQLSASLSLKESGWFLVRAITDRADTFRFASTAPFYVEVGQRPSRVSRRSAAFFRDWAREREERVRKNVTDAAQLREVVSFHQEAVRYWSDLADRADAE